MIPGDDDDLNGSEFAELVDRHHDDTAPLGVGLLPAGIDILTGAKVEKVTKGQQLNLTITTGEGTKELKTDVALMAVGVLRALGVPDDKIGTTDMSGVFRKK